MNPIVRNILAVIVGIVVGGGVNMALIMVSGKIIPLPPGVNPADSESLKASMHLFGPQHFIFPFLAHALGTFVGAFLAALIAASHKMKFALGLGAFYLLGGIAAVFMLPAPMWFAALDLIAAYLPMAWIAGKLATPKRAAPQQAG